MITHYDYTVNNKGERVLTQIEVKEETLLDLFRNE